MPMQPERLRFPSLVTLAALVLLTPGCTLWQFGDVAPDYVNASTHRGAGTLAFDAESKTLASGGWDGEIAVWTLDGDNPERVWQAHEGFVVGIAFSGDRLISGGQDGRLVMWSRRGQAQHSVDTGSKITHVQVLNDLVVTGHYDGSVRAWTLPAFDNVMRLDLHREGGLVTALAVDPQSRRIASSGYDGRVFLIEGAGRYRELERPPTDALSLSFVPWGAIAGLQYLPGEEVLASISRVNDSSVFFLDPVTGESVRHFQRQSICGTAVGVSPDEHYLATTGDDGIIRIWDLTATTDQ
jgi:WD40 repeat protein